MPTDRWLIEIMTTFGGAGVKEAQAGMLGLGISTVALGVGFGAAAMAAKSMIDLSEQHIQAENSLAQAVAAHNDALGKNKNLTTEASAALVKAQDEASKSADALTISQNAQFKAVMAYHEAVAKNGPLSDQAYKADANLIDANIRLKQAQDAVADTTVKLNDATAATTGTVIGTKISLEDYRKQIEKFIDTNKSYISDQSEVVNGYAALVRSGLSQTEVQRVMNDALDLAALKHISLTEAVDILGKAESGRMKGLIDLGITTSKYVDAQGNLVAGSKDVAGAMDQVDAKVKGGRDTLTDAEKAHDRLAGTWQHMANQDGPALEAGLARVLDSIDKTTTGFNNTGDALDRLIAHPGWQQLQQVLFGSGGPLIVSGGPLDRLINFLGGTGSAGSQSQSARERYSGAGYGGPLQIDQLSQDIANRKTYNPT